MYPTEGWLTETSSCGKNASHKSSKRGFGYVISMTLRHYEVQQCKMANIAWQPQSFSVRLSSKEHVFHVCSSVNLGKWPQISKIQASCRPGMGVPGASQTTAASWLVRGKATCLERSRSSGGAGVVPGAFAGRVLALPCTRPHTTTSWMVEATLAMYSW